MGDVIVLIVLVLIVGLVLRSRYTQRKNLQLVELRVVKLTGMRLEKIFGSKNRLLPFLLRILHGLIEIFGSYHAF